MAAWVKGTPVDLGEALRAGGRLLGQARMPVVTGLVCEVDAIRAAYRLAFDLGGALDPAESTPLYADLDVLAGAGMMTTTESETIGRADVVVVIGSAVDLPLIADIAAQGPSRGTAAGTARTLVAIGPRDGPAAAMGGSAQRHRVAVDRASLPAALAALRALVNGRLGASPAAPGLTRIATIIGEAAFGVVVYNPADLSAMAVEMLQGLVKDINRVRRFSSLPVSANFQQQAVLRVGAWTTGGAPRVGFGRGFPEHDPWRFDAARLIAAGEADAAVWLASLPAPAPDWLGKVPGVALLGQASGGEADIVIRVAVPGETASGILWDARRGALVHKNANRSDNQPTAADVLASIGEAARNERASAC